VKTLGKEEDVNQIETTDCVRTYNVNPGVVSQVTYDAQSQLSFCAASLLVVVVNLLGSLEQ
jgi:hypothetical protein